MLCNKRYVCMLKGWLKLFANSGGLYKQTEVRNHKVQKPSVGM